MKAPLPSTVSRPELLDDGRDDNFRRLIADLLQFGAALQDAREDIAAAMHVSAPQYAILMSIARFPTSSGPTVSDVALQLRVSVPFIVAQNRGLVAKGLLRKQADPEDGRRVRLALSTNCRNALIRLAPKQRLVNDALFASLTRTEFLSLQTIIRKMVASLDPEG